MGSGKVKVSRQKYDKITRFNPTLSRRFMADHWFHIIRRGLIAVLVVSVTTTMLYGTYYRMQLNGSRAEMRLMLTYLHTLQQSYRIDEGRYVFFNRFYGAQIAGEDHCQQPEEAARLGFILRWCHEEQAVEMRYAYQILPSSSLGDQGFQAIAHSGSDGENHSFVCFFANQTDVWSITEEKALKSLRTCD